jgi:hypothetical protein
MQKRIKKSKDEEDIDDEDDLSDNMISRRKCLEGNKMIKKSQNISDMLIQAKDEGSPNSFRLLLSGTPVVNTILDIFIYCKIFNAEIKDCAVHNETHEYHKESFWKSDILPMIGKAANCFDVVPNEKEPHRHITFMERAQELYLELIKVFYVFDHDSLEILYNI